MEFIDAVLKQLSLRFFECNIMCYKLPIRLELCIDCTKICHSSMVTAKNEIERRKVSIKRSHRNCMAACDHEQLSEAKKCVLDCRLDRLWKIEGFERASTDIIDKDAFGVVRHLSLIHI